MRHRSGKNSYMRVPYSRIGDKGKSLLEKDRFGQRIQCDEKNLGFMRYRDPHWLFVLVSHLQCNTHMYTHHLITLVFTPASLEIAIIDLTLVTSGSITLTQSLRIHASSFTLLQASTHKHIMILHD